MKVRAFELIVGKEPDALNRRVNEKIAQGWDVMFGCSGMNQTATKFCVWMAEPIVRPVPAQLVATVDSVPAVGAVAGV